MEARNPSLASLRVLAVACGVPTISCPLRVELLTEAKQLSVQLCETLFKFLKYHQQV